MVLVAVLLPAALIGAAAVWALLSVRRSSLRITAEGVEVHNYRQPVRLIPLAQVAQFEEPTRVGNLSSVRPRTAVLVLTDSSRLPVRSLSAPEAGYGIDALNARVEWLRRNP